MFSIFLCEGPVRNYAEAKGTDSAAYGAFFHSMLDQGVHLPPSAYEAWFVSGAHDDAALDRVVSALPAAARAARRRATRASGFRLACHNPLMSERTVVHLVRHGEVYNPEKVLYGRLPGYHLSERGQAMARVVAGFLAANDVTHVVASSLTRAKETAAPIAAAHDVSVTTDDRVIEAANAFEGQQVALSTFLAPRSLPLLRDVRRPSWGEPYAAHGSTGPGFPARAAARGHEAIIVSHQLPIWIARLSAEGRRLWHDPRSRVCTLASVTSFAFAGDQLTSITYAEPAAALLSDATASVGA